MGWKMIIKGDMPPASRIDLSGEHHTGLSEFSFFNRLNKTKAQLEKVNSLLLDGQRVTEKFKAEINDSEQLLLSSQNDFRLLGAEKLGDLLAEYASVLRELYEAYRQIIEFFPGSNQSIQEEVQTKCTESFGVKAAMIDGYLALRTPLVASGQNAKRFGNSYRYLANQFPWMSAEIQCCVGQLITPDDSRFGQKTIMVFSVYPDAEKQIPDPDNILVKAQIDAITSQICGGDAGEYCSIFMRCKHENRLLSGTYFVVSVGCNHVLNDEELVDLLQKL